MLFQLLHHHLDRFVELRVVALALGRRVEIDFIVWGDAVILNFPLAFEAVDSGSRRRDVAAVEQFGITADADQPAPRPLADQRTECRLFGSTTAARRRRSLTFR